MQAQTNSTTRLCTCLAIGADFEVDFERVGFWDLRIATANTYSPRHIFIAGDAAHSHPPYGGYGINTGLEDARNLGWKMQAEIEGWAGPRLLDSYTEERRPVSNPPPVHFVGHSMDRDRAFISAHDPRADEEEFARAWQQRSERSNLGVTEFEPHYEGSPIVFGPADGMSGALGSHLGRARAGHHLAPPQPSGGKELFAALGRGFSLLTSYSTWEPRGAHCHGHRLGAPVSRRYYGDALLRVCSGTG